MSDPPSSSLDPTVSLCYEPYGDPRKGGCFFFSEVPLYQPVSGFRFPISASLGLTNIPHIDNLGVRYVRVVHLG